MYASLFSLCSTIDLSSNIHSDTLTFSVIFTFVGESNMIMIISCSSGKNFNDVHFECFRWFLVISIYISSITSCMLSSFVFPFFLYNIIWSLEFEIGALHELHSEHLHQKCLVSSGLKVNIVSNTSDTTSLIFLGSYMSIENLSKIDDSSTGLIFLFLLALLTLKQTLLTLHKRHISDFPVTFWHR